jgi:hypothetical protein
VDAHDNPLTAGMGLGVDAGQMIRRRCITDDDAIDDNVTTGPFTPNIAESLPGYFQ